MIGIMKRLIFGSLALIVLAPQSWAQGQTQVNYSAPLGERTVYTLSGTPGPVQNGNEVWLGTFDTTFVVAANQDDPAALLATWIHYDETPITSLPPFNQPGSFSEISATSDDPVFNNKRMYLWIFSTDGAAPPAADFSNVNAYGLFTSTSDLDWIFPDVNTPFPGNVKDISTDDIDQALHGSFDNDHLYLSTFTLVPEPSVAGLLSLGIPAVVLVLRKRRAGR
jgi:hypothetical protein